MMRLSFAWRVTLVVILALVAVQLGSAAINFARRSEATATGLRFPFPDQVAALVELIETSDPADERLILRALNGPGLTAAIRDTPAPVEVALPRIYWLQNAIRRNLPDGDARPIIAVSDTTPLLELEVARDPFSLFVREPVQITIGLSRGRSLFIHSTDNLSIRLLGLPAGFLAGILGFIVASLAGLAILRETRPLAKLASAVERFGHGMTPEAMPEKGAPEMRSLIRAFNAMQARITRLVHGRTFVLAAIAHDLRTYLTRLRLRVALIPEEHIRVPAERDVEDMQALLEQALLYAKSTRYSERREPIDLVAFIDDIAAVRREAGAKVIFEHPHKPFSIAGGRLSLASAIGNLIDNAINYGGAADLSLEEHGSEVVILVEDRGPGIPESDRERVLEPFERLEGSRSRDTGGAGLGLAIVREVVDAHSGRVFIEDRPGGGARVGIALPR
ncbi:ATP-binding protein [Kaistia dalseonensis]|uniref:histidine kinase n=1 Tax=Kaistia dalseonensis TaxID=410840 RepID=A0ABU0H677_9HYPH|nr:ATP-binding protein [Kaistia dalseonensis]MCX5494694.1 ATP-binding protein [Kaistia dalseonensis]MDQ0437275.1 signal transduction histidine kinase [Kaistia dalseonensis]